MWHQYIKKKVGKILKIIEKSVSIIPFNTNDCLPMLSTRNCKKAQSTLLAKWFQFRSRMCRWPVYSPASNRKKNSKRRENICDLAKAYDSVSKNRMWWTLKKYINNGLIRIRKELYTNNKVYKTRKQAILAHMLFERQNCGLSPFLQYLPEKEGERMVEDLRCHRNFHWWILSLQLEFCFVVQVMFAQNTFDMEFILKRLN